MARPDALNLIDGLLCGKGQVPAKLMMRLLEKEEITGLKLESRLIKFRMGHVTANAAGEFIGAIATFAMSRLELLPIAGIALGAQAMLGMVENDLKNQAGSMARRLVDDFVDRIGPYRAVVEEAVVKIGIPAYEVGGLSNLGTAMYVCELYSVQPERLVAVIRPFLQALALLASGKPLEAGLVALMGSLSIPTGEVAYKQSDLRRRFRFRHARSSKDILSEEFNLEHIRMVRILDAISYIPQFLLAGLYLLRSGDVLGSLSTYRGISTGMSGLSMTLTAQRTRVDAYTNTGVCKELIKTLTNAPFLLTKGRLRAHLEENHEILPQHNIKDGIVINNFKARLPNGNQTKIAPINFEISNGNIVVVKADSGTGKTETILAFLHMIEHDGFLGVVDGDKLVDVHELLLAGTCMPKIIAFEDKRTINQNWTLPDLFIDLAVLAIDQQKWIEDGVYSDLLRMALHVETTLIDQELKMSDPELVGRVYPKSMKPVLAKIVEKRRDLTRKYLDMAGGNLAQLDTDRMMGGLSDGERQRLGLFSVWSKIMNGEKPALVILDEPLSRLDATNKKLQLKMMEDIQNKGIPILCIAHAEDADNISTRFNSPIIDLNLN